MKFHRLVCATIFIVLVDRLISSVHLDLKKCELILDRVTRRSQMIRYKRSILLWILILTHSEKYIHEILLYFTATEVFILVDLLYIIDRDPIYGIRMIEWLPSVLSDQVSTFLRIVGIGIELNCGGIPNRSIRFMQLMCLLVIRALYSLPYMYTESIQQEYVLQSIKISQINITANKSSIKLFPFRKSSHKSCRSHSHAYPRVDILTALQWSPLTRSLLKLSSYTKNSVFVTEITVTFASIFYCSFN